MSRARRYTEQGYTVSQVAIRGFASAPVERFFREERLPRGAGWVAVARVVARKLDLLDYAGALSDLASPPGNRLEALRGDLAGFHSVRINDQWRIVFRWTESGPSDVDVRNYH
jgi:proteic killer suppression protein